MSVSGLFGGRIIKSVVGRVASAGSGLVVVMRSLKSAVTEVKRAGFSDVGVTKAPAERRAGAKLWWGRCAIL